MDTANPETVQGIIEKSITIKDIELQTPPRWSRSFAREYYARFSVGTAKRSTKGAKETKDRSVWHETFHFVGNDHSDIVVDVYQKHRIGKDTLIGSLVRTIGGVSEESEDGVLQDVLREATSVGPGLSAFIIKFSLVAEPRGDAGGTEGKEAVNTLNGPNVATSSLAFETIWDSLLQKMELLNEIVTGVPEIQSYTSLAWSVTSVANKLFASQWNGDERVVRLAGMMDNALEFVDGVDPLTDIREHMKTATLLIQQVTECGYFIAEYAKQGDFSTQPERYAISDIDAKITTYENRLQEYKTALLEGVEAQTEITVVRVMNAMQDIVNTIDLKDIPYANGAKFQSEKGCLPGTRVTLLREICDVLNSTEEDAPQVYLLTGVAGSGKSAVAHTIAQLYDGQRRLGSSYSFAIADVANRNSTNLLSTIARDLSDLDLQFKFTLWRDVKDDRILRSSQSPTEQLKKFIIEPFRRLHTIGPIVIVIDALDESGDPSSRQYLLPAISQQIADGTLPANLHFFITARPEADILAGFPPGPKIAHKDMRDIPEGIVDRDIEMLIHHSLHQCTELESSWADQEQCRLLVRHSQKLFQWAFTACNFIQGLGEHSVELGVQKRFEILVEANTNEGTSSLDSLYRSILDNLFPSADARHGFLEIMAIAFALKEPLSITSLSTLLTGSLNTQDIIKQLGSLLGKVVDEGKLIQPFHTSFREFLLDEARSEKFHVQILPQHSHHLGRASLDCMQKMLRFNICDLRDSRVHNIAIVDLAYRMSEAIPPHLAYACRYWMDHLKHAECTLDLQTDVTHFFNNFLAYWLEAISLLSLSNPFSYIQSALETCTTLRQWTKSQVLGTLASETFKFIQVFAPVLRMSTPHLYLSAIPQTPNSSPLHKLWSEHLQKHNPSISEHPYIWPAVNYTLQGHTGFVSSVAYLPDGIHAVSGSTDKTIRIWNTTTGQCVAGPFLGHTSSVSCIACSPLGKHVVSGSQDKTLRVWNLITGQCIAEPFQGHNSSVTSVAYSPDGTHIVSGSLDKTIRVWDASTGYCVAGPFQAHISSVSCVAYSPNSTCIVSGSQDRTIRIWDASTGESIAGPFQGHMGGVTSVAYSPDGVCIVSGSLDKTIRVWNASTGQCVAGPFQGHTSLVNCVGYSLDGLHIVSGSWDKTIRIWDVSTEKSIANPLEGHKSSVTSIAYSSNGTFIISGSWDKDIMVWDATTAPHVPSQLQEDATRDGSETTGSPSLPRHTDGITCIAYSPDGTYIASGSKDNTIRIQNATTGMSMGGPLEHAGIFWSIAYSPDGAHLVSGSSDSTIIVWDVNTGQDVAGPFQGHAQPVRSVAYSPNGTHIISGSEDSTIRIWDAATAQCVVGPLQGHTDGILSVAYSPDGAHIVSGSMDRTIRIWDAISGQCIAGPFQGHTDYVDFVAYSPDGTHVASGSDDRSVRIWDVSTGQCVVGPLLGHTDEIWSVAYSPDGTHIVSGSRDHTFRIWNVKTGECVAGPFQEHTGPVRAFYSPDGKYLVSISADCSLKIWRIELLSYGSFHEENGWVQSSTGAYFGWVAPWKKKTYHFPIHSLVISPDAVSQVDFDSSLFGESWTSCWQ